MRPADRPVLLVLRALGLGDLLAAVPALRALRDARPGHTLVLAMPRALAPLAQLSGAVDRVLDSAPLQPLRWDSPAPDLAVNLHGRGPQSHRVLLATSPRSFLAFAHSEVPETEGMPGWDGEEHEVRRWCRLVAEGLGVAADPSRLDLPPPPVEAPAVARGATLVHPGAAFASRRWPAERWAAVARAERDAGRRVVVTGGENEVELAREVARLAGLDDSAVLAGRTGILELAATVAAAARVACNDTGVAHLATAYRRPSVVVFGPTPPALWGPPPRVIHRVLWAGRRGDPRGDKPDPGLLAVDAEEVIAALSTLPDSDDRLDADQAPSAASSSRSDRSISGGTARRSRTTQGSPRAASTSPPSVAARS